jgi:hypothetical protein
VLFEEIEGSITIEEGTGLQQWRGRFWLPDSDRVEAGHRYCLMGDDGRAGELVVDNFGPGGIGGDVAVFRGKSRFE